MVKNFDLFFDEYKEIHKKSSEQLSIASWPMPEKIIFTISTVLFGVGIAIFIFVRGYWLVTLIGIINFVCSVLLVYLLVKYGTKHSKRDADLQRIVALDETIKKYIEDYSFETLQLLTAYASDRISRRNPFSFLIEALSKTGVAAVLVLTFFAGAQSGEIHTIDCLIYSFISVSSVFEVYLIAIVCKDILEPVFYPEKYICADLIDDLKDLKLFSAQK